MKNLVKIFAILLIGIIIGSILFGTCRNNRVVEPIPTKKEVVKVVENVQVKDVTANKTIDSLQSIITDANKHVEWLELNSDAADNTIATLRNKVALLAKKSIITTAPETNEGEREDLQFEIESLNAATDLRDSLCDATVTELKQVSGTKDSIISTQKTAYNSLKNSFDTVVKNNYTLIDFTKQQKKQIRKEKRKSWIWKGGILTLGYLILKK